MRNHLIRKHKNEYVVDVVSGQKVKYIFDVYLCFQVAVDKKGALTDVGQQFVTPMNSKAKSEWDKEFVRWFLAIIHLYINLIAEYILIFPFYFRWFAKSARPLNMGETDKAFRAFIKKITLVDMPLLVQLPSIASS